MSNSYDEKRSQALAWQGQKLFVVIRDLLKFCFASYKNIFFSQSVFIRPDAVNSPVGYETDLMSYTPITSLVFIASMSDKWIFISIGTSFYLILMI